MNGMRLNGGMAACLFLLASSLQAQEPAAIPALGAPIAADPLFLDPPASAPACPDKSAFTLYPPGMFGDLLVIEAVRHVGGGNVLAADPPVAFISSFKIAENESPRPLDRVFLTGNFYSGVDRSFLAGTGVATPNVYREMLGFEKTFLQGDASVGMRLPYFQLTGDPQLAETRIGDVSVILKYAFLNDRSTGKLLSGGLVLTAPTGQGLPLPGQSTVNPLIVQPWVGGIWNWKSLFVQNFMSVAVPTDARAVALFFKSVSVGYWLYRTNDPSRIVSAIVPDA